MPLFTAISIDRAGLVPYELGLSMQRDLHLQVASGEKENTLILLEHPSVYTAGRRTLEHERPKNGTSVIDVDRGGKITWHGPGQLVGYPIVKLENPHELVGFVRELEAGLIKVGEHFGIAAVRVSGRSGVWVCDEKGERKIAAIGIRVASGVTMHGFALNVCPDLLPFTQIIPCGIEDASVTSLEIELGRKIDIEEVLPVVEKYLHESLEKVAR